MSENKSVKSGWSYVLDCLIEVHPAGLFPTEMHDKRPEHLNTLSIEKDCSRLFKLGVLRRVKERIPGQRMPRARYFVDNLDKLPSNMRYEGSPGSGQGVRIYKGRVEVVEKVTPDHPAYEPPQPLAASTQPVPHPPHPPVPPQHSGPYFGINTSKGLVKLTLRDAKIMYEQLKEIFE
jgi:hypothetical protein